MGPLQIHSKTDKLPPKVVTIPKHSRLFRLEVKILEAKYLQQENLDYHCVVKIDNQNDKMASTQVVSNLSNPFWAEEFQFESEKGFLNLNFTVWGDDRSNIASPVLIPAGKAIIPRKDIKTEEVWYMLKDATFDSKIMGSVQVQIKHFPPKMPRKVHGFSVTVIRAKQLSKQVDNDMPNPFVVLHILPDPEAITTQHTHTQRCTNDPNFNEMFFFTCNAAADVNTRSLHVSLWNQDVLSDTNLPGFLGHVTIPLGSIIAKKTVTRWYNLMSLPDDTEFMVKKKKTTEEERRNRPRDFLKTLHHTVASTSQKPHSFTDKVVCSLCPHCSTMMVGTQSGCSDCKQVFHSKCIDSIPPTCGGVGAIRLKMNLHKTIVLDSSSYLTLMEILHEEEFKIMAQLGKFSSAREEAAKCMIRILDVHDESLDFVKAMVYQEIMSSEDPKTLFRANSMASKALDVYMKHVGTEYLHTVLEDVLKLIVISKKTFEIDPLRIEKDKKRDTRFIPEESVAQNAENLKDLNIIVTDCIFASANKMPTKLKIIFELIQNTVNQKFPGQDIVRYTAVSGFIFLRFFAPAILGPPLFGLKVGILDQFATRKLLLIAKTLQNLSNLVEFGQKEPFMEPMNAFINSKIGDMKNFLDAISKTTGIDTTSGSAKGVKALADQTQLEANRDCADLVEILSASMDKLRTALSPESELLKRLTAALQAINKQVQDIETKDASSSVDLWNDIGTDSELPGKGNEAEEDKKLLRMLSRCPSNDDLDSPLSPLSIGNYKTSSELKDQMVKGSVTATVPILRSPILSSMESHQPIINDSHPEPTEEVKKEPPRLSELPFQISTERIDYLDIGKLDPAKAEPSTPKQDSQNMFGILSKIKPGNRKKEKEVERSSIISMTKPLRDKELEDTATIGSRSSINLRDPASSSLFGHSKEPSHPKERSNSNLFKDLLSKDSKPTSLKNLFSKEESAGKTQKDLANASPLKSALPVIGKVTDSSEELDIEVEDDTEGYVDPFALANSSKGDTMDDMVNFLKSTKPSHVSSVSSSHNPSIVAPSLAPSSTVSSQASPTAGALPFIGGGRPRRPSLISSISAAISSESPSPSRSERTFSTAHSDTSELLPRTASANRGNRVSAMFTSPLKKKSEKSASPLSTVCPRCKLDASDVSNQVNVDQKKYHPACLTCSHCKVKLTDEVFFWKDDVVCQRDFFFLSGFTCSVCDSPILNNYVTVGGKKAHAACKPCSLCHQSLFGKDYTVLGDSIFCSEHKDIVPCFACQKRIDGAVLEAHGRFYHPNHFLCMNCGKDLNGCVNYEMDERNYCQWCYMSMDVKESSEPPLPKNQKGETAIDKLVAAAVPKDPVLLNAPNVKQRKQSLLAFLHG